MTDIIEEFIRDFRTKNNYKGEVKLTVSSEIFHDLLSYYSFADRLICLENSYIRFSSDTIIEFSSSMPFNRMLISKSEDFIYVDIKFIKTKWQKA